MALKTQFQYRFVTVTGPSPTSVSSPGKWEKLIPSFSTSLLWVPSETVGCDTRSHGKRVLRLPGRPTSVLFQATLPVPSILSGTQ